MNALEAFLHPVRTARALAEARSESMRLGVEIERLEADVETLRREKEAAARETEKLKRSRRSLAVQLADVRARLLSEIEAQKADESTMEQIIGDIELMKEKQAGYLSRIADLRARLAKVKEEARRDRISALPESMRPIDMTDSELTDPPPAPRQAPKTDRKHEPADADTDWLMPLP